MLLSPHAKLVRFEPEKMWVELDDGRTLGIPLTWFPRLLHGTREQRAQLRSSPAGLHWEDPDEDISIMGLVEGRLDRTFRAEKQM